MWSYDKAAQFYSRKKKCNPYKTIDHSGRLFYDESKDEYEFQLHSTIIVKVNRANEYTLAARGWHTSTTAARIREYSGFHCHNHRLQSVRNGWVVGLGWDGQATPFYDGIRLTAQGELLTPPEKWRVKRVDRAVSKVFSTYQKAIWQKLGPRIRIGEFDGEHGAVLYDWPLQNVIEQVAAYEGEFVPHELASPLFRAGERYGRFGIGRMNNSTPRSGEDAFRTIMARARKTFYGNNHGYIIVEVDHV